RGGRPDAASRSRPHRRAVGRLCELRDRRPFGRNPWLGPCQRRHAGGGPREPRGGGVRTRGRTPAGVHAAVAGPPVDPVRGEHPAIRAAPGDHEGGAAADQGAGPRGPRSLQLGGRPAAVSLRTRQLLRALGRPRADAPPPRPPAPGEYTGDGYLQAVPGTVQSTTPTVLLVPHPSQGHHLAPAPARTMDLPLVTNCLAVDLEGDRLVPTR